MNNISIDFTPNRTLFNCGIKLDFNSFVKPGINLNHQFENMKSPKKNKEINRFESPLISLESSNSSNKLVNSFNNTIKKNISSYDYIA